MSHTSPIKLRAAQRRLEAIQLRRDGLSFTEIGSRLGISRQMANRIVRRELQNLQALSLQEADLLRTLEADRLDLLLKSFMPKAREGDHKAADVVLKVIDRRAKLFGLDAPTRTENQVSFDRMSDQELLQEADRMGIPVSAGLRNSLSPSSLPVTSLPSPAPLTGL